MQCEDAELKAHNEFERRKAQFNYFNDPKKLLRQIMNFSDGNLQKDPTLFSTQQMHSNFTEMLSQGKMEIVDPKCLPPPMTGDMSALHLEDDLFKQEHQTISDI